jgi:2-polyprenyl-6-methoxyphenol hydroxylase-like FAD-dependent oxidoreductase
MKYPQSTDVVVVGGGPTGMTVAGDLARAGRSVTVLEKWPSRNPASRAFVTMPRTQEVLDSRGLAEPLLALGAKVRRVKLWRGAALHLDTLASPYPFGLVTPQTNVDGLLADYATREGATIVRGAEVTAMTQDDQGVSVTTRPPGGGPETQWHCRYLVAADGAHSTVRRLCDIDFPGREVLSSVVLADILLTNPPADDGLTLGSVPGAFAFLAPYGNGWYRCMTWDSRRQLTDTAAVSEAEIRDVAVRAMGRDPGIAQIGWRSRFHCEERQVADYRHGRVFLAGDAAHVHSPMGGQGMNTGIQDAVNLAWKLDLALGGAPEEVLDTYQTERHPIGRRVLLQSGAMMRAVTLKPRSARLMRNLFSVILLNLPPVARLIAGSFSGVSLRYPRRRGQSGLVGTRATMVPLSHGQLTAALRAPGFLLVREKDSAPVDSGLNEAQRTDDGPALLIRPDGYIAWAGSTTAGDAGWRAALAEWTGTRMGALRSALHAPS